MELRLTLIIACLAFTVFSSPVSFLNDEDLTQYKIDAANFIDSVTKLKEKTVAENKGKPEPVKTQALNTYKDKVMADVQPYINDYQDSVTKKAEAENIIANSKSTAEILKAEKDLDYYTQKLQIIENLDENLRNLETQLILELTFGDER